MRARRFIRRVGLMALLMVLSVWIVSAEEPDLKKRRFQKHWWEILKPSKPTPEEQLKYAAQLKQAGRLRKAAGAYRALVYTWPESPEAPVAQFNYAGYLYQRGKLSRAFDEYQFLVEVYTGFFPYEEVISRQYTIADKIATRKSYFLFIPYKAPEEAIPLFEQLIKNAPQKSKVSDLQFRIGRIYEQARQYDLAIEAYQTYKELYPHGSSAEQASFRYAVCFYHFAMKNPTDTGMRDNTVAAFQYFLDGYPRSEMADLARAYLKELQMIQATAYYRRARAYEKSAGRTSDKKLLQTRLTAAKIVYQRLINECPGSWWVDAAWSRIGQINRRLEGYHEH